MIAKRFGNNIAYHGDCIEVMGTLGALGTQVDSIVTDPPYHLSTVKRFANSTPAKYGTDGLYQRASKGFMGKEWDGGDIAFQPDTWRRCYDLLKPGGYLLAFSGSRTYHRIACAIEDAGFEIRDQLMWLYGTGFPKSHDVSKAIDKAAGAEREVVGRKKAGMGSGKTFGMLQSEGDNHNAQSEIDITAPATDAAKQWEGWGTALKPAHEPIVMARKPLIGTVAENVLTHGTGAINIDACRVGTDRVGWGGKAAGGNTWNGSNMGLGKNGDPRPVAGRFPANVLHDGSDEVLEAFAAYGESKSRRATVTSKPGIVYGGGAGLPSHTGIYGHDDQGTAARFFYSAKATKKDRAGSNHPTVKPVALIEYFCKLVTQPGGVVLDPFAGSGTLGDAWPNSILIEREEEYYSDIIRRLSGE